MSLIEYVCYTLYGYIIDKIYEKDHSFKVCSCPLSVRSQKYAPMSNVNIIYALVSY